MSEAFRLHAHDIDSIRRQALEFAGIGLLRLSMDGIVTYIDLQALRILQLDQEHPYPPDVVGKPIAVLAEKLLPEALLGDALRREGGVRGRQTLVKTSEGVEHWIRYDCYYASEPGSDREYIQIILHDATAGRRSQEQAHIKQMAVDASVTAIALADLDGTVTYANSALAAMWGYDRVGDIVGRQVESFWADESVAGRVRSVLLSKNHWAGEIQARRINGELFDAHLSATRVLSAGGSPQCLMLSCVDISELKRIEKEPLSRIDMERLIVRISTDLVSRLSVDLKASVAYVLQELAVYAQVPCAFLVFEDATRQRIGHGFEWRSDDTPGHIANVEGMPVSCFGWAAGRLTQGDAVTIASVDELGPDASAEQEELKRMGIRSAILVPVRHNDNVTGVIGLGTGERNHPWAPQIGNLLQIAGEILANVAQRHLAENELVRRAEFERVVNAISTQFIGMPPDEIDGEIDHALKTIAEFVAVDRCYLSLLSVDRGTVVNSYEWCADGVSSQRAILENITVGDAIPWAAEQLSEGQPFIVSRLSDLPESAAREKELLESQSIKSVLNVPITVSRRLTGIFGLESVRQEVDWSEDMVVMATIVGQVFGNAVIRKQAEEERQRLEAQVRHGQKLESLGVLAGGIAHDFNNILMGIIGNAGLALMELPPNSPVRECIWHIEKASQHAAELTNQLLAYSGKGAFSLRPVNLSEITDDLVHLIETVISKRAFLSARLTPDLPAIEGDPGQLRQVIMNLVTNASDAVEPNGGNIRIVTGAMFADRAYLTSTYLHEDLKEGQYAFIEVSDTGTGMDSKTIGRMFDPFFSTKFTGRGLGLAAVLGIVRAHRGAVKVDSEVGHGTVFRVLFPCTDRAVESAGETAPQYPYEPKGETVLVVDDEAAVRRVVRLTLERSGYKVLTASDGEGALHAYRHHVDEIRCVLLDVTMPVMDGIETYYTIRKMDSELPIVLSSGYSETDARERISEEGRVTFIQKPYTTGTLVELITRMIERGSPH